LQPCRALGRTPSCFVSRRSTHSFYAPRQPVLVYSLNPRITVWRTPMLVPRPMGTSVDALGDDFRFRPSRLGRRTPCRMTVRWNPKAEPCSTGRLTLLAAALPLNSYAVRPDA